jgi:hypothetical protein
MDTSKNGNTSERRKIMVLVQNPNRPIMISETIFNLKLTPMEFIVYCTYLKSSKENKIFSNKQMAKMCNICLTSLKKVKKNLSRKREELGGKSLIKVFSRYREDGAPLTDLIEVEQF